MSAVDGSGVLDYSEFLVATMDHQKYIQEDVCWSTFKTFDNDNSGHITKDELRLALTEGTLSDSASDIGKTQCSRVISSEDA